MSDLKDLSPRPGEAGTDAARQLAGSPRQVAGGSQAQRGRRQKACARSVSHVQSMADSPAASFPMTMSVFAAALNVSCDYCHVPGNTGIPTTNRPNERRGLCCACLRRSRRISRKAASPACNVIPATRARPSRNAHPLNIADASENALRPSGGRK